MLIPMTEGEINMRSRSGVRFKVKSDTFRGLRVDVESSANSSASHGVKMGWEVSSDSTATTIELRFADMALPEWATSDQYPQDNPGDIQRNVGGLIFSPSHLPNEGWLGDGVVDTGFLQVDNIEFF